MNVKLVTKLVTTDGTVTLYQVKSGSRSGHFYHVGIDQKGVGHHTCTCPAWVIKRNKNGGSGAPSHCKHIDQALVVHDELNNMSTSTLTDLLKSIEDL